MQDHAPCFEEIFRASVVEISFGVANVVFFLMAGRDQASYIEEVDITDRAVLKAITDLGEWLENAEFTSDKNGKLRCTDENRADALSPLLEALGLAEQVMSSCLLQVSC